MNFNYLLSKHGYMPMDVKDTKLKYSTVLKRKLAEYLGRDQSYTMDDFAKEFGGITRKQYIELAYERFKK
jgi:hypothetical protein